MAAAAQGGRARPHQQPAVGQPDGAALLSLRLRRGRRPLHALCDHASSRTICGAGSRSTRCTFPSTRSASISPDVGGGFGVKGNFAGRGVDHRLGRATAAPAGQMDRDALRSVSLRCAGARSRHAARAWASTADGRIVAMQIDTLAALGGYLSNFAPSIPGNSYPQTVTGLYRTPNLHLRVRGVYTNTVPVDAYRGSGRPEATWINERLLELGARELGIDVVEIRRRNLHRARPTFPIRRRAAASTIPAIRRRCSTSCWRSRTTPALRREQAELRKQRRADGHRPRLLHRQGRHRAERAISPSAAGCTAAGRAPSCACTPTAR